MLGSLDSSLFAKRPSSDTFHIEQYLGIVSQTKIVHSVSQQTRVYPYPLGAGSARPNSKMGAPDPENPLFLGFSVLRGGLRPWSQTMVSEGARPWGGGRSGDCESPCVRNGRSGSSEGTHSEP